MKLKKDTTQEILFIFPFNQLHDKIYSSKWHIVSVIGGSSELHMWQMDSFLVTFLAVGGGSVYTQ